MTGRLLWATTLKSLLSLSLCSSIDLFTPLCALDAHSRTRWTVARGEWDEADSRPLGLTGDGVAFTSGGGDSVARGRCDELQRLGLVRNLPKHDPLSLVSGPAVPRYRELSWVRERERRDVVPGSSERLGVHGMVEPSRVSFKHVPRKIRRFFKRWCHAWYRSYILNIRLKGCSSAWLSTQSTTPRGFPK